MGYKKYVSDYTKKYVVKPNGRPGVTATYTGKYFRFSADSETIKKSRITFACLSISAMVFTLIPLFYKSIGAHTIYVALPHAISLFPLIHLLLGVYNFCFGKTPMIRELKDKTENRTTTSSIVSTCILLATAVAEIVNCFIFGFPIADIIYAILLLCAGAFTGYIFLSRKVLKTEECSKK